MIRKSTYTVTALFIFGFATTTSSAQESYGARLVLTTNDTCPAGRSAIFAAVLPSLVDHGVDFIKELIKEKSESYEATFNATAAGNILINCGTAAAPSYGSRVTGFKFGYGPVSKLKKKSKLKPTTDPDYVALGFTSEPNVYMEADFVSSGPYIAIEPKKLIFNDKVAKSGTEKDLVLTLTFDFPSATAVAEKVPKTETKDKKEKGTDGTTKEETETGSKETTKTASAPQQGITQIAVLPTFERLSKGTEIDDIKGISSSLIAIPQPDSKLKTRQKDQTMPFSLKIIAKETDRGKGGDLWLRISKVIEDNKDSIAKAILGEDEDESEDETDGEEDRKNGGGKKQ